MKRHILKKFTLGVVASLFLTPILTFAGDDPSIKGKLRKNIQSAMTHFIKNNTIKNIYYIYDETEGKMLRLTFKSLHKGIVKKGDFYVSCADFLDQNQNEVDLDFFVIPNGRKLHVTQALVHKIDGKKRPYHLE